MNAMRRSVLLSSAVLLACGGLLTPPAAAQTFEMDFLSIVVGGTIDDDPGPIEFSGALGEAFVGRTSGGAFTFVGGFWSVASDETGRAPTILSWSSARLHRSTPRLLALDPADGVAVSESRQSVLRRGGGPSGIRSVVVRFDQPVQPVDGVLDPADVTVRDHRGNAYLPDAVALLNGGVELAVGFNVGRLPDQRRYTLDVAGRFENAGGQVLSGDANCDVRALVADVNSSGLVDLNDVILVAEHVGISVDDSNARLDIDTDGSITIIDVLLVAVRLGLSAP